MCQFLFGLVQAVDVALMMRVMVKVHRLPVDIRLQRIVWVGKGRQCVAARRHRLLRRHGGRPCAFARARKLLVVNNGRTPGSGFGSGPGSSQSSALVVPPSERMGAEMSGIRAVAVAGNC